MKCHFFPCALTSLSFWESEARRELSFSAGSSLPASFLCDAVALVMSSLKMKLSRVFLAIQKKIAYIYEKTLHCPHKHRNCVCGPSCRVGSPFGCCGKAKAVMEPTTHPAGLAMVETAIYLGMQCQGALLKELVMLSSPSLTHLVLIFILGTRNHIPPFPTKHANLFSLTHD